MQLNSLVKGSKCPTVDKLLISSDYEKVSLSDGVFSTLSSVSSAHCVTASGTRAVLSFREWSGEYRLSMVTDQPSNLPPVNAGERVTSRLSNRAAQLIEDSSRYVSAKHQGFTTFLTLTLDNSARSRIQRFIVQPDNKIYKSSVSPSKEECLKRHRRRLNNKPLPLVYSPKMVSGIVPSGDYCRFRIIRESSIQREASRFFDALNKLKKRGFVPKYYRRSIKKVHGCEYCPIVFNTEKKREFLKITSDDDLLRYLWVAESPLNDNGDPNPHIHVLLNCFVPFSLFPAFKVWTESVWSNGFAHLEKLKNKEAAGYYLLKAINYISKGAVSKDQGEIIGNRYGISSAARAPSWVAFRSMEWGYLGYWLQVAREKWRVIIDPLRDQRRYLSNILANETLHDADKKSIKKKLNDIRREIVKLPIFARSFALFRDLVSIQKFIAWAENNGWSQKRKPCGMFLSALRDKRKAIAVKARFNHTVANRYINDLMFSFYSRFQPIDLDLEDNIGGNYNGESRRPPFLDCGFRYIQKSVAISY